MSRNFFIVLLVVVVVGAALLFIYKTPALAPGSVEQGQATAEFGGVSLRLEYATTTAAREL